ncbi:MAG: phosphoheptose isomerase family protein [Candidatus Latescibacterota bacterium]
MSGNRSRRRFWRKLGGISLAAGLTGAHSEESSASIPPGKQYSRSLFDQYCERFGEILATFESGEPENISRAAEEAVNCIQRGGKLFCNLLGHLFYKDGGEIAPDRIGNPALFSLDTSAAKAGDFLVVMSPAEAKKAKEKGVFCVGFTSPYYLNEETPPLALADAPSEVLRNPENLMLSKVCDITVRCHTAYDEGILNSPSLSTPVIPATSQITALFYWALAGEITVRLARKGIYLSIAGEKG